MLHYVGDDTYFEFARKKLEAVQEIQAGIETVPDLYLLAEPEMTLISFSSKTVNIFHIIDEMHMKGWYIQPSFSFENVPANIHLSINLANVGKTDIFIADLKESVEKAKALPSGQLLAAVNEMIEKEGESVLDLFPECADLVALGPWQNLSRAPGRFSSLACLPVTPAALEPKT